MLTFIYTNNLKLSMSSDLVKVLDALEKKSEKNKTEVAHYLTHDGKILFSVNGEKSKVAPNKSQIKRLKELGNRVIITHNHPAPNDSPLTKEDMKVAIYNDSDGIRAVTEKYTYVALRPRQKGWGCTYQQFDTLYDKTLASVTTGLNKTIKTRGRVYHEKMWHETMEKVCKKLGIKYFRFLN